MNFDLYTVLRNARVLLAERGLAKCNTLDRETGGLCLRGAVLLAASGSPHFRGGPYERELQDLVTAAEDVLGVDFRWNNRPETTLEDVLAAFDRGIQALRPVSVL